MKYVNRSMNLRREMIQMQKKHRLYSAYKEKVLEQLEGQVLLRNDQASASKGQTKINYDSSLWDAKLNSDVLSNRIPGRKIVAICRYGP
jgi:hypothetical protein